MQDFASHERRPNNQQRTSPSGALTELAVELKGSVSGYKV